MKLRQTLDSFRPQEELIATFGAARLVRKLDGTCELRGGTPEDQQEARQWMSMFWHEATVWTGRVGGISRA